MNRSYNCGPYLVWSFEFGALFVETSGPVGRFDTCGELEFCLPIAHVDGSCCVASDDRVCERSGFLS
jgi:hypothetical protein